MPSVPSAEPDATAARLAHQNVHTRLPVSVDELAAAVPASHPGERLVTVHLYGDARDVRFPALVHAARWNGYAVPSFRRDVAEVVVDWTNSLHLADEDDYYAFWYGDTVVLVDPAFPDEWESIGPHDDGRYSIGAYQWTWAIADHDDDDVPRA